MKHFCFVWDNKKWPSSPQRKTVSTARWVSAQDVQRNALIQKARTKMEPTQIGGLDPFFLYFSIGEFSGSMLVFKGLNATPKFNSSPLKIGIQGPKRKGLSFSNHHFSKASC